MKGEIRGYRDLIAWQRAFELGVAVYAIARKLPRDERFGLTSQLQRSAISVASNIAEGYGRGSKTDYLRFLRTARGSLYEVDTQLLFTERLGYIPAADSSPVQRQIEETGRVLAGLIRSLEE